MTNLLEGAVPPRFEEFGYGMVIADGMGLAGGVASQAAIITLAHMAVHIGRWNLRIDERIGREVMDRLNRIFRGVDSTVFQAGQLSMTELKTTLTGGFIAGSDLLLAHSGHSRAYLFRDGGLLRLTRDHSVPGGATNEEGTTAIGIGGLSGPNIDVRRCGLLDNDVVLLCTNGLTDVVNDARIEETLRWHSSPDGQCRTLVDLVTDAGGQDDVTVVAARYRMAV